MPRCALEDSEVRFAGQEIAAVAAVSPEVAAQALGHIKVEYTPLPFVVEMDRAMAAGAPKVFGSRSNVADPRVANFGDVARALREAAAVHEALYTTPVQTHVSLETHGAVASWKGDELTVWCSTQGVFTVRDDLAVLFDLPPDKVRVITEYLGGGFGSKFGAGAEVVIAARLARLAGAPVKLMLPRAAEHVATGNRPSSCAAGQARSRRRRQADCNRACLARQWRNRRRRGNLGAVQCDLSVRQHPGRGARRLY